MINYTMQTDNHNLAIESITVTVLPDGRMNTKDAARYLGVSVSTLARMRNNTSLIRKK